MEKGQKGCTKGGTSENVGHNALGQLQAVFDGKTSSKSEELVSMDEGVIVRVSRKQSSS